MHKPISSIEKGQRQSQQKGGIPLLIEKDYAAGTPPRVIRQTYNLSVSQYRQATDTLRRWGVRPTPKLNEFEVMVSEMKVLDLSDQRTQELLDKVNSAFYKRYRKGKERPHLLIPLKTILLERKIPLQKMHDIASVLKESDIPIGMIYLGQQIKRGKTYPQRYFFILTRDIARVEEWLNQNISTGKNRL